MARFKAVPGAGYGSIYIDSLIWGGQTWNLADGPLKAATGRGWADDPSDSDYKAASATTVHGAGDYMTATALRNKWYDEDHDALNYALGLYESVCNISFVQADNAVEANLLWWKTDLGAGRAGVHESPATTLEAHNQRWGYFNPTIASWGEQSFGGDGLNTLIHEIGHGLGLAHPHDGGLEDDATTFPGATKSSEVGVHGLNQSVYTVMSYNPGLNTAKGDMTYGTQGGLGALDIAALQILYGTNTATATGNDTYTLPTSNGRGTGWTSIWDAGGIDTISAAGSTASVTIDLRAATLMSNDPNAGGFISQQTGIAGGFTIANKVVIENAAGGSGNDTLIGNDAVNVLSGGLGNDIYYINSPNDVIIDAGGNDTVYATFNYKHPSIENVFVNSAPSQVDGAPVVGGYRILLGTSGKNKLVGGAANDRLYGKAGIDTMTGGKGKDIFVFDTKPDKKANFDKITDFIAKDDTIWLDNKYFAKLGKGTDLKPGKLNKKFFTVGSKAKDKDDFLIHDKVKGIMFYDADGSGTGKAVEIFSLTKKIVLTTADFGII